MRPLIHSPVSRLLLSVLLISGLFAACKKETFTPAAVPQALLLVNPEASLDILSQPLKKEMIVWNGKQVEALPVDGYLQVEFREDTYLYIQVSCPPELKCNGAKAYVPVDLAVRFEEIDGSPVSPMRDLSTPEFQLITRENLDRAVDLREWMEDPSRELPADPGSENFTGRFMAAYLQRLDPLEREQRVAEWFYLAISYSKKLRNPAFAPHLKRYAVYTSVIDVARGKSLEDSGLNEAQGAFLKNVSTFSEEEFNAKAAEFGHDFPFQESNYDKLADYYNTKIQLPLYRELILKQIMDDVPYSAHELPAGGATIEATAALAGSDLPPAAEVERNQTEGGAGGPDASASPAGASKGDRLVKKVLFDLEFGAVITYEDAGGKEQEEIFPKIAARGHEKGLSFLLETEEGKRVLFKPLKLASYLEAASPRTIPGYKNYSQKKIMAEDDYRRRLMLAALKYGTGQYDRRQRRFSFVIDLGNKKNYWNVLSILKTAPHIDSRDEGVYSGVLATDDHANQSDLRWFQKYDKATKKASFGLVGSVVFCGRGCFDDKIEGTCFENQEENSLEIQFPGRALQSEKPEVTMILDSPTVHDLHFGEGESICAYAIGAQGIDG